MYSLKDKVTTSTCDEQGKLKLFAALQMMQDCSELWFNSEPTWKEYYGQHGMTQVLAFRQVEVVRMPVFGEDITVETIVFEVTPRFGYRNTMIYDAEHKPCVNSWSMGAFVNRHTGQLSPASDEACKSLTIEPKLPMNYLPRKITIPKVKSEVMADFDVWQDYIDYNSHVNNAQYIRMAEHCIPVDFHTKGLRVEFKHPARLGDLLTPYVYRLDEAYVVVLKIGDAVSTIVEFT